MARTLAAWPLPPVAGLAMAGQAGQSLLPLAPYQLLPYVTTQPAGLYPATLEAVWLDGWMGGGTIDVWLYGCMAL